MKAALVSFALALAFAAGARAEAHRAAVIVGANRGAVGRAPLRYSYRDADAVADALADVGGFSRDDLHVLHDPEPDALLFTLDRELKRLRAAGGESLFVFYYSGHADAAALYPDGKPLSFADLRQRLESLDATVRVGIVDACSGGGFTGTKGLKASAPFAVDVPLELSGEGSVLIASSSGVEDAHESEQLLGSYFTHHLVAGLRGAADSRGDGIVTLADAFAYAKERTVRDTAAVAREPQHPSFSMNLRGRTDLPLARVATASALLELHEREGPLQLVHLASGLVVLEVPQGRRELKLAVQPGRYLVRRQLETGSFSREVAVEAGKPALVREDDLQLTGDSGLAAKRFGSSSALAWPLSLSERPLTLFGGMAEFTLNAVHLAGPAITGSSLGLSAGMSYGLTDWLTAGLHASSGNCLGSAACDALATGVSAGLTAMVYRDRLVELGPLLELGYAGGGIRSSITGQLGLQARTGGRYASLTLKPALYAAAALDGQSGALDWAVTATLVLQPFERLAFVAAPLIGAPFGHSDATLNLDTALVFTLGHRLDLRLDAELDDLWASYPGTRFADRRIFTLQLALRP